MMADKDVPTDPQCKGCGICCRIYTDSDKGGSYPSGQVWFQEWCEEFHDLTADDPTGEKHYGVKPLFDPLIVHMDTYQWMIKELDANGIDAGACQYLGKDGCMIEYSKRPVHCRRYYCEKIKVNHG
jgi:hypothetical protein